MTDPLATPRLESGDRNRTRLWIDDSHSIVMGLQAGNWLRHSCRDGLHEPKLSRLMIDLARTREGPFFDIGALYGYFSLLVGLYSATPRVIRCFEMNPQSARLARRMLTLNNGDGAFDRSQVRNIAVAARDQTRQARVETYDLDVSGDAVAAAAGGQAVRFEAMDRYCERKRIAPSFIKMDIEGWEGMALNGMVRTLRTAAPVLAIELHASAWIGRTGLSRTSCAQMLLGMGYRLYSIGSHRDDGDMKVAELHDPGFSTDTRRFENQGGRLLVACRDPIGQTFPGIAFSGV